MPDPPVPVFIDPSRSTTRAAKAVDGLFALVAFAIAAGMLLFGFVAVLIGGDYYGEAWRALDAIERSGDAVVVDAWLHEDLSLENFGLAAAYGDGPVLMSSDLVGTVDRLAPRSFDAVEFRLVRPGSVLANGQLTAPLPLLGLVRFEATELDDLGITDRTIAGLAPHIEGLRQRARRVPADRLIAPGDIASPGSSVLRFNGAIESAVGLAESRWYAATWNPNVGGPPPPARLRADAAQEVLGRWGEDWVGPGAD